MSRTVLFIVLLAAAVALLPGPVRGSLYQPDDTRTSIPAVIAKQGEQPEPIGQELPYDEFKIRLLTLMNQANPDLKHPTSGARIPNPDRDAVLARIAARQQVPNRSAEDTAALAADLLRVGQPDAAEAVLARERQGFLPTVTLAHVYATRGDWAKAYECLDLANSDRPPTELKGLTREQLAWQLKLNRGVLAQLFEHRWQESRVKPRPAPEDEDVDPIFPIRFVNEQGKYEPGKLAPAERAKLPPDAVAQVQQLLLWHPSDTRLYWLLAELYAATGRFREAADIFEQCSWTRQYGRKILMAHRAAVQPLAAEQAKKQPADVPLAGPVADTAPEAETPPQEPDNPVPFGMGAVWIYFGAVAGLFLVLVVVRVFVRRGKPARSPFRPR